MGRSFTLTKGEFGLFQKAMNKHQDFKRWDVVDYPSLDYITLYLPEWTGEYIEFWNAIKEF